jgi:hypothetical protein
VCTADRGVAAERPDEAGVPGRRQADDLDAVTLRQEEGGADGRLGRGARDDHGARPEEVVVAEEVVHHEGGDEQRPQQHLLVLTPRRVGAVGTGHRVAGVDGGNGLPAGGRVGEPPVVEATRGDDELVGQREVAVDPGALGHARSGRLDHVAEAPHRDPAPRHTVLLHPREAVPVAHEVAVDGVGDVVGGHPEGVDPQSGLAGEEGNRRMGDRPHVVEVGPVDVELHGCSLPSAGPAVGAIL